MMKIKNVLTLLWMAPVSLPCFLFYILPCWCLGWYRFLRREDNAWIFVHGTMPEWLANMWKRWRGQCVGNCVVLREVPEHSDVAKQLLEHEMEHVRQVATWGILQPIMYFLSSLGAEMAGLDPYRCNPWEMAARKAAGQKINLD